MESVVNPQTDRTTFTYDNAGRLETRLVGSGSRVSYTYDNAGRVTYLANLTSSNTMISSFDYDAANQLCSSRGPGRRTIRVEIDGAVSNPVTIEILPPGA